MGVSIRFDDIPKGKRNLITDVPGVLVGHKTRGQGDVQTGVTAILPHGGNLFQEKIPAAVHVINGLNKEAVRYLKAAGASGKADANLIEVMMCEGGCVNGCSTIANAKVATRQLMSLDK